MASESTPISLGDGIPRAVAEVLGRAGTTDLFGVLGAGNLKFVGSAVHEFKINYHALRHESAAVAAADAYARVSGRVGVATVTHGPGLTHASSAIVEASKSRIPVLIVTSSVSPAATHQNQSLDQDSFAAVLGAVTFWATRTGDVTEVVSAALEHVTSHRQPVILMLSEQAAIDRAKTRPDVAENEHSAHLFEKDVTAEFALAAQLLMSADRPVILAGRGAMQPDTLMNLRGIGQRIGALLYTTLPAKDSFDGDDFDMGVCGSFGDPSAMNLAEGADVVLIVGSSVSSWTTRGGTVFADAAVIRCDIDEEIAGTRGEVFLGGESRLVTAHLSSLVDSTGRPGYRSKAVSVPDRRVKAGNNFDDESDKTGLDPRTVVRELDRLLPRARSVVVDGGHFSGWPAMLISTPPPGTFTYAHGYQCVGLALGNVVGVALGNPSNLPVAFVGDGGLLMSLGELHAIAELRVPVLVIVLNDGAYGAEFHQAGAGYADLTRLRRQDFAKLAEDLGGTGIRVTQLSDLRKLFLWLESPSGLCVVDTQVTRAVEASWLSGR